jgi:hypothetical protein
MWCAYMLTGFAVFPECATNRSTVRCVGTQVLSPYHCFLHMCTHPSHDYQHMVSTSVTHLHFLVCLLFTFKTLCRYAIEMLPYQFSFWYTLFWFIVKIKTKLHGLSPWANCTDRATAACRRNDCQLFVDRGCHVVSVTDPYGRILGSLDRSRYFFFQVASQLYSRGWVDPVPDPLLFFPGSAENRTRA